MKVGKFWFLAFLVAFGFQASCRSGRPVKGPEEAGPGVPTIGLGRVISRIPPGSVVGGKMDVHSLKIQEAFFAADSLSPELEAAFLEVLSEQLTREGFYPLARAKVFGLDDSWKSDLILQTYLTSLENRLFPGPAKTAAHAIMVLDWEIVDRQTGKILLEARTFGSAGGFENLRIAQVESFRKALGKFLTQNQTKKTLRKKYHLNTLPPEFKGEAPIAIPWPVSEPKILPAEEMIENAGKAVISIRTPHGHGTGFFVRPDGLGITCKHVTKNRDFWDALLQDGRTVKIQILRRAENLDLALFKALDGEFPFLPMGLSNPVRRGQEVFAIGTPVLLGLSQSVSRGIVSALRLETHRTLIQTDAAINPGSSGGPLLNQKGEVIGVINLKLVAQDIEGIGFCLAVDDVRSALNSRIGEIDPSKDR